MKNTIKQKEGFTLLITIIGLALMTTLGFAILTSTTNNFKATEVDSKNQRAYYIAEAGINYTIDNINSLVNETSAGNSDAFFSSINNGIKLIPEKMNIKENFPLETIPNVKITPIDVDNTTKEYLIESTGSISESKRTVSSTISVKWATVDNEIPSNSEEVLINTESFEFTGGKLNAPNSTISIKLDTNTKLNGGSHINAKNIYINDVKDDILSGQNFGNKENPGSIYINNEIKNTNTGNFYGNLYVSDDFKTNGTIKIYGDLYVVGNLKLLNGGTEIFGNVFVEGKVEMNSTKVHGDLYAKDNVKLNSTDIKGNIHVEGELDVTGGIIDRNIFAKNKTFLNNPTVKGSIFITSTLNSTNGTIDGDVYSTNDSVINNTKLKSNLTVKGNLTLTNGTIEKNVYVDNSFNMSGEKVGMNAYIGNDFKIQYGQINGNVSVENNHTINGGTIKGTVKKIKFDLPTFPSEPEFKKIKISFKEPKKCKISLNNSQWYEENGYEVKGNMEKSETIISNKKWFGKDNIIATHGDNNLNKIVIISRGDITLKTPSTLTGALIAPNGKVDLSIHEKFEGVIVSKDGLKMIGGGLTVNMLSIEEYFGKNDIPFSGDCSYSKNNSDEEDSNNSTTKKTELVIKKSIKEN